MPTRRPTAGLAAAVLAASISWVSTPAHAAAAGVSPPTVSTTNPAPLVGTPITFNVAAGPNIPTHYTYEVNGGPTQSVQADAAGNATITLTPTTRANVLDVVAVGADGSTSLPTQDTFFTHQNTPAVDKDLTGDGVPDLVTVGNTKGLGSGLWMAKGMAGGRVATPATDIGANGWNNGTPSDYNGTQVITGLFRGEGFQDILIYEPSGFNAGGGGVVDGSGDGSVLYSLDFALVPAGSLADAAGDNPQQLANAYDTTGANGGIQDDLVGISGDATNGYHLEYYACPFNVNSCTPLSIAQNSPDGTPDWNAWTMATAKVRGNMVMFLWNKATGVLYLWENVIFHDNGDSTASVAHTQYKIAKSWQKGAALTTLEAADLNNDGIPDLWAVTDSGVATSYFITKLSATSTAKITTGTPQKLY